MHIAFAVVLVVSITVLGVVLLATQTTTGERLLRSLRVEPSRIVLIPGTVELPAAVEPALRDALARDSAAHPYYALTAFDCDGSVCFASLASFDALPDLNTWTLDQAAGVSLVVLNRRADGGYDAAREDEVQADALLAESQSPAAVRLRADRRLRASDVSTATVSYDFPWTPGSAVMYGSLGVHRGGFIAGWRAVDFLSDGNTSLGHAPNELRTAAEGVISYVCNDGVNVAVRIGNLMYVHLLPSENRLRVGESFARGERLGALKPGSYSARCGYASQQPQNFHVHLAFPDAATLTMGGWTLSTADGVWRRGDSTWHTSRWLRNDVENGPLPTSTPATPVATHTPSPTHTPRATRTPTAVSTATVASTATPCPSAARGDADCDGQVDGVDYSLWLSSPCLSGCVRAPANFNSDGAVDEADFQIWLQNRTTVLSRQLWRGADAPVQARLVVTNVSAARTATGLRSFDLAVEVVFEPMTISHTLHYARVELAIPTDTLRMPAGAVLDIGASGLGRVIEATNAEQIAASGFLRVELGAQSVALAPQTTQTLTLAIGRFEFVRDLREPLGLMLYGAQFVTDDGASLPVTYASIEIAPDRRTNLPMVMER